MRLAHKIGPEPVEFRNTPPASILTLPVTEIIATWIAERQWHASQQIEESEKGVILTMEVGITPELEQWILSFGENARVMEPAQLVAEI